MNGTELEVNIPLYAGFCLRLPSAEVAFTMRIEFDFCVFILEL